MVHGTSSNDPEQQALFEQERAVSVHPSLELARVLDVTGLHRLLQHRRDLGDADFHTLPSHSSDGWIAYLDQRLSSDEPGRQRFVEAVLKALNSERSRHPNGAAWVLPWSEFVRQANDGPESWLEALGMRTNLPTLAHGTQIPGARDGVLIPGR
jgi:hypothetical protein